MGNFHGLKWVNFSDWRSVERDWLKDHFEFHELDYEDLGSRNQRPKVDEYDDYLFIVLQFPRYDKELRRLSVALRGSTDASAWSQSAVARLPAM